MGTTALIGVEEYLGSDYSPDVDYVDGVLETRELGQRKHAALAMRLVMILTAHYRFAYSELRLQVSETRFRVPDVVAMDEKPGDIITTPPLVCIEIASPGESFTRLMQVSQEYVSLRVPDVFIVDPFAEKIYMVGELRDVIRVDSIQLHKNVRISPEFMFTDL